jgi:hypothetical protein
MTISSKRQKATLTFTVGGFSYAPDFSICCRTNDAIDDRHFGSTKGSKQFFPKLLLTKMLRGMFR